MFKLEIAPLIYYFAEEAAYDWAKNINKSIDLGRTHKIIMKSMICINTETNTIIKNRGMSITDLVEKSITLENPRKEITIVVHGGSCSGKTRIAALINKLLFEHEFQSSMEFKEENPLDVYDKLDESINYIKDKVKIVIKENTLYLSGGNQ